MAHIRGIIDAITNTLPDSTSIHAGQMHFTCGFSTFHIILVESKNLEG